ncbi:hypothetical protein DPMN_040323 [Dreissena polymorpha]|uniref:Uncharacterized protein n=1 Tax=Dreissena polymorpha TaxID=45954 RepID=A0A9D4HV36_DREPO|nr:hypothetical protein DPMN_040323 [Dreissena polymorpha]
MKKEKRAAWKHLRIVLDAEAKQMGQLQRFTQNRDIWMKAGWWPISKAGPHARMRLR